jgi:hypothetical protein
MRVVSRHEHKARVVVGDAVNGPPESGTEWAGDMIHAASGHGDIFVGYVGEDNIPVQEPGFWEKVTDIIKKSGFDVLQNLANGK